MLETVLKHLAESDSFAAITALNQQEDALSALKTYSQLIIDLYWKEKNLPAMVMMARAGIQQGLISAVETQDSARAIELRSTTKAIAYNLASFTWPGWDEPDIDIGATDIRLGLDAAKLNLRLAQELQKGDLPLSRAHWLLAGFYLATDNLNEAEASYKLAETHAIAAEEKSDQLLAQGFVWLTRRLVTPHDQNIRTALTQVKEALQPLAQGDSFISQIETANRVFTRRLRIED